MLDPRRYGGGHIEAGRTFPEQLSDYVLFRLLPKAKQLSIDFEALGQRMPDRKAQLLADGIPSDMEHAMVASAKVRQIRQRWLRRRRLRQKPRARKRYFYPTLRAHVWKQLMNEANEEHHVAKVLIAELDRATTENDHRDAKFKVLAENVRHHIRASYSWV